MLMKKCHKCFHPRRKGFKKKKSVRGSIVSSDIGMLQLVIVKKGNEDIPGITDCEILRRLGPKRANKIRKLYNAEKGVDVRKLVIRRAISKGENKVYYKAPKIQRLITSKRLRRKKLRKRN